ncbi:MAG: TonB-dependent receptor [Chitinophagales bacterium]
MNNSHIKFLSIIFCMMLQTALFSQTTIVKFQILEEHDKETLIGATVYFEALEKGAVTDVDGFATVENVPFGSHEVHISFVGYEEIETEVEVSETNNNFVFSLEEHDEHMNEVVVKATRSTRTIQNIPTRVELIGAEELSEKAIMNSANISLVLRESTGIQIQQSSLSSGNSSIRIQGLDGRYTQLLKDGFPLYGGFAGGLSIMQIPPLDLQQFEIIKGSSSTLYGGGAIAGLVNMVSKTPDEDGEPMMDIMLTQTQALGSTANVFYGKRTGKLGYTLYGSGHYQNVYDNNDDDFSNLPQTTSFAFNPKLFYYPSKKATFWLGINATYDERNGGDVTAIKEGVKDEHSYIEENTSKRISTQALYEQSFGENKNLQIKNSISFFDRNQQLPLLSFSGIQWNTFSEANFSINKEDTDWIFGANIYSNNFKEKNGYLNIAPVLFVPRDQNDITFGAFANNTTDISEKLVLESGFRLDYSPDWGIFPLPRVSLLWKPNHHFSSRLGGGLGYKIPDMFTEAAVARHFQGIQAINKKYLDAERSVGLNLDLHYKGMITEKIGVSINQLFYLTSINNATILVDEFCAYNTCLHDPNFGAFMNAPRNVVSTGAETNIKFSYKDFRWFINYAFIDVGLNYLSDRPQKFLTAKHNAGMVLMYENDKWRIGYEAYYTGKQRLSNGSETTDFVTMGLMVQKHFKWGSPFINFENFTDRKQSRFSEEVSTVANHNMPVFREIYAPTDGFIFTAGVVIKPFGNKHEHH